MSHAHFAPGWNYGEIQVREIELTMSRDWVFEGCMGLMSRFCCTEQ